MLVTRSPELKTISTLAATGVILHGTESCGWPDWPDWTGGIGLIGPGPHGMTVTVPATLPEFAGEVPGN